jgi:DNA-binding response OmpR family regulator
MERRVVMIVEDDEGILEALRAAVEELDGVEVALATDGEEALWRAQETPPALVVLDVMMPGLSGFEVCRRLKADPRTSTVPVMIVSALPRAVGEARAASVGCDAYLEKPFELDRLVAQARALVSPPG